jgi:uncharacterized protein
MSSASPVRPFPSIPSPCTGVCRLDGAGYCLGCQRTGEEIAGWLAMTPEQRHRLIDVVLPARRKAAT